jgi:hypothetical protein
MTNNDNPPRKSYIILKLWKMTFPSFWWLSLFDPQKSPKIAATSHPCPNPARQGTTSFSDKPVGKAQPRLGKGLAESTVGPSQEMWGWPNARNFNVFVTRYFWWLKMDEIPYTTHFWSNWGWWLMMVYGIWVYHGLPEHLKWRFLTALSKIYV